MTDAEYYRELEDFTHGLDVRDVVIDPSAASFIAVIRKSKRYRAILASNEVVAGIGYTASLFHIGKLASHAVAPVSSKRWAGTFGMRRKPNAPERKHR